MTLSKKKKMNLSYDFLKFLAVVEIQYWLTVLSYRVRPSSSPTAWDMSASDAKSIKLLPQYHKNSGTSPPEFHFDEILTGSENKPVYNAVARSHVWAAMDGFNSVVFAYGQTASGKTFTLVGHSMYS